MPVYSDITNEDLISTLDKIDEDIAVARSINNVSLLSYCLVVLYEYCVCISYMMLHSVDNMEHAKATLNTIKDALNTEDEIMLRTLNKFYDIRNALCHNPIVTWKSDLIPSLLTSDLFYVILEKLNVKQTIIQNLKLWSVENYQKDNSMFNPWNYIRQKVGDYVNLLPVAAVDNCKSEEECQDLIDSLQSLF